MAFVPGTQIVIEGGIQNPLTEPLDFNQFSGFNASEVSASEVKTDNMALTDGSLVSAINLVDSIDQIGGSKFFRTEGDVISTYGGGGIVPIGAPYSLIAIGAIV